MEFPGSLNRYLGAIYCQLGDYIGTDPTYEGEPGNNH